MIHDRASHPYGFRATLDAMIMFAILMMALAQGAPHWSVLTVPGGWLNARFTLEDVGLTLAFLFSWRYCFSMLGLYRPRYLSPWRKVALAVKGCLLMDMVLYTALLVRGHAGVASIARIFFLLSLSYVSLRLLAGGSLHRLLTSGNPRRVLILGSGSRASKAWRAIRIRNHKDVVLLGFVDNRDKREMAPDVADRYLGSIDKLSALLLREVVDTLIIALPAKSCYGLIQSAIDTAEQAGVSVVYLGDVFSTSHRPNTRWSEGPFTQLVPVQDEFIMRHQVKRAIDILGASIGLILGAPVLALIAIAVKATSPGEVFFFQERFGYQRRRFRMVKFRSMVKDAPALMASLESLNELSGPAFKLKKDPRITPLGKLLRAASLDELPQLWNVLKGDMSLVGPRPMSIRDVTLFGDAALMRRFSVKPGLTGLWQVSGRSNLTFDQWMAYDFHYIDRWSLTLDLEILARTITAVTRRSGAM